MERIIRVLLLAVITAIILAPMFIWAGIVFSPDPSENNAPDPSLTYPGLAAGSLIYPISVSLVGAFIHTLLSFGLGYGLARGRFPFREELKILTFLGVMIPISVIAGPVYWLNVRLGITGLFPSVFLAMWSVPWLALTMMYYLARLPERMETYAASDGLKPGRIFSELILPYSYRGLISVFLLAFLINYNSIFATAIAMPPETLFYDSSATFTYFPKLIQVLKFDSALMPLNAKLTIAFITQIPAIIILPLLIAYGVPALRTIVTGRFIYRKGMVYHWGREWLQD